MKLTLQLLFAGLLLAVAAAPVSAADHQPTGDRINLLLSDTSYPANTSFHVRQGFSLAPDTQAFGRFDFTLEVDGTPIAYTYRENLTLDTAVTREWIFNFPGGMTGAHTFTGHWIAPCGSAYLPCGSSQPNSPVEVLIRSVTVTFTDS